MNTMTDHDVDQALHGAAASEPLPAFSADRHANVMAAVREVGD